MGRNKENLPEEAGYSFLSSSRATLGTESGSNVFDFNGEIPKEYQARARLESEHQL